MRIFNSSSLLRLIVCLLLAAAPAAMGQANIPIYTDNLVNAFQNESGNVTTNYYSTTLVHSGSYSLSVIINSSSGVLSIQYPSGFDTRPYSSLSFWINGGATGGQLLKVAGSVGDVEQISFALPKLATNTWQQMTIPLSSLGGSQKLTFTGFTIRGATGGALPVFYLDDVQITAALAPSLIPLHIDASQMLRQADARWFGVNTATWDSFLGNAGTLPALREAGALTLRFPGGSTSDANYHWASDPTGNSRFRSSATNLGANQQVFITVNYGTGTSNEAAAWVLSANVTNQSHFQYWEIGNECYGTWETDSNNVAHDPYTYAMRAAGYIKLMKAADPTIHVGVVATPGDDAFVNNTSHPVVNPRTHATHNGWTPVMLTTLASQGVTPDFLVHHVYPQFTSTPVSTSPPSPCTDSDPFLLQASTNWGPDAATLRQEISDYFGAGGTNIELVCTENNSDSTGGGKQLSSLVNALYMADSLGKLMKTEFNSYCWWDLRNGAGNDGNYDPTLYGWRTTGDFGLLTGATARNPDFYSLKLMQYFVRPGDAVLSSSSTYALLSAYAARKADGALTVLVINKDSVTNLMGQINLGNFTPSPVAVVRSYGMLQDNAAKFKLSATLQDIATNTFTSSSGQFTNSFPPYSLTLFTFSPAAPQLQAMPGATDGQFVFQLQGQPGTPYVMQTSLNGAQWTSISTNLLTNSVMTLTNPIAGAATSQFWRAVWQP